MRPRIFHRRLFIQNKREGVRISHGHGDSREVRLAGRPLRPRVRLARGQHPRWATQPRLCGGAAGGGGRAEGGPAGWRWQRPVCKCTEALRALRCLPSRCATPRKQAFLSCMRHLHTRRRDGQCPLEALADAAARARPYTRSCAVVWKGMSAQARRAKSPEMAPFWFGRCWPQTYHIRIHGVIRHRGVWCPVHHQFTTSSCPCLEIISARTHF